MELIDWSVWWGQRGAEGIRRILMVEWDPIGVSDMPDAADEYDRYGRVVGLMLLREVAAAGIEDYLRQVRTHYMGLGPGVVGGKAGEERARNREHRAVDALCAWYAAEDGVVSRR